MIISTAWQVVALASLQKVCGNILIGVYDGRKHMLYCSTLVPYVYEAIPRQSTFATRYSETVHLQAIMHSRHLSLKLMHRGLLF